MLLGQVEGLDAAVEALEDAIHDELAKEGNTNFSEAVELLKSVPGIGETSARAIVAEIGVDMARFGSASRLCAWAGVAPGNRQSGGKRLSGKTLHGNKPLQSSLVEAAWAATHQKDGYLGALHRRLAMRRGGKRALIAVAHSILRSIYYMLTNNVPYTDLGKDHFDRINPARAVNRLAQRAKSLGYEITPAAAPA